MSKRRFALYLSAVTPAVAAVTLVGTGVSQAEVSRVSPGPRIVAAGALPEAHSGAATHTTSTKTHRTKPVVQLTCHETDKPAAGTTPASGTSASQASSAASEADSVTCRWSHIRRHLKVGSFELMRSTGGSGSTAPSTIQTLTAKARSYTDTSVADGTSYTYVLQVLGADGSQVGTSNAAQVKDRDDRTKPACDDHATAPGDATTPSATNCPAASTSATPARTGNQRPGGTSVATSDRPDIPTTASHRSTSDRASLATRHRDTTPSNARPNGSRSHRGPAEQASHD